MNGIRRGLLGTALVAAVATTAALLPGAQAVSGPPTDNSTTTAAVRQAAKGTITSKVFGEFGRSGTVRGTFDAKRFLVKRGDPYAVGVLHATLRRGGGALVGHVNREITIPVKNAHTGQAALAGRSCQVLDLVLGPLDLNLLGLKVHLNRVVLNIEAAPGAGALLGNLLCAVTGLLDRNSLLSQLRLVNILNRILDILNT